MGRKILFAVPTNGEVRAETVLAIADICRRPDIDYFAITGSPVEQVRNNIVLELLKDQSCTHVMMMDSDISPPSNIVDLLLECDSDMACGIAPIVIEGVVCSNVTDENGHWVRDFEKDGNPFEVTSAGTGVVLIKREVFENIPWPWFKRQEKRNSAESVGEDIYFSRKAAKFGYKYKAHPKAICGHIKQIDLMKIVGAWNDKR